MPFVHALADRAGTPDAAALSREQVHAALVERDTAMIAVARESNEYADHAAATTVPFASSDEMLAWVSTINREQSALSGRWNQFTEAAAGLEAAQQRAAAAERRVPNPARGSASPNGDGTPAPQSRLFAALQEQATPYASIGRMIVESPVWQAARRNERHVPVPLPMGALTAIESGLAPGHLPPSIRAEMLREGLFERMHTPAGLRSEATRSTFDATPPADFVAGIDAARRETPILQLPVSIPTTRPVISYRVRTTRTNNAEARAETAAYPQVVLGAERLTEEIRQIGASLEVTDWLQADDAEAMIEIEAELPAMIREVAENRLINGSGTAPQPRGILNPQGTGVTLKTEARSGNTTSLVALMKGIADTRLDGLCNPNAVLVRHDNWGPIRRATDTVGNFIWAHPLLAGGQEILGVPVIETVVLPAATGVIGDFRYFWTYLRSGLEASYGYVGSDFEEGKERLRVGWRLAYVNRRPDAFRSITGLQT